MEENTQTQTAPVAPSPKKGGNNALIVVLLILVVLIGGGYLAFQFYKAKTTPQTEPQKQATVTEDEKSTEEPKTTQTEETGAQTTGTGTTQTTTGSTTTQVKADIDGDLKNLDELDLSSIENDYGDDTLSEL